MNWLLMVSDDGSPDFEVGIGNNVQHIFEEYGAELILMFILGILVGIGISCIYCAISKFIKSKQNFPENLQNEDEIKSDD